jgi:hypothetical protein
MKRRDVMLQIASSVFFLPLAISPAFAETNASEAFRVYTDETNKFEISIPQDWQVGQAEPNGFKSITAFYPQETSTSNVSIAITGLGPDFTRMESFGKVEAFAETLVSGLDRSWQKPVGVTAKLIDSRASKGFYYIEYTLQNPGEARKHLYSAIGMAPKFLKTVEKHLFKHTKKRKQKLPKWQRPSIPSASPLFCSFSCSSRLRSRRLRLIVIRI